VAWNVRTRRKRKNNTGLCEMAALRVFAARRALRSLPEWRRKGHNRSGSRERETIVHSPTASTSGPFDRPSQTYALQTLLRVHRTLDIRVRSCFALTISLHRARCCCA
jgi:hypothetical protein